MAVGWESNRIRFVPMEVERHFENICRWVNDPDVNEWILVGDFPMGKIAEKE